MASSSLLARVTRPEAYTVRRTVTDRDMRESVLEHLRMMCTTRQGTMLTCPDYGVASVSEMVHSFPDAIALMARTLRHTIQTYEPRLTNIQIRHIPSENLEMTVRYEVAAQLIVDGSKTPVKFETNIDPSKRISVR